MPGLRYLNATRVGRRPLVGALILMVCLAACGGPARRPLPAAGVVLAFGDSLTYGSGAQPEASYPAQLEQLIGRRVVNAGVPGEISRAGLARLPQELEAHRPDLVIICHGGNDLLRRTGAPAAADNIRAMIRLVQTHQIPVVLIGVPELGLLLSPPRFYAQLAREFDLPYEGQILAKILAQNALKSDAIHPNAAGYRLLAEALAELLRRAGLI